MDEALIQEQERQLQKTGRYYKHVFWLCVPLLCMACYFYGARPLLLCGIALLTGNLCDRLVALLRHRVYTNKDLSNESFSLIIALLMPATVDIYVLVVAVLAGVLIGKEVFGGYGSYPFNPAAVLRRGGGIVAGAGGALPAALYAAAPVERLRRAGKQHHRGYPAQRRYPEPERPRRCAGRVCCPHGHRRGAGHSGLRPCAVDPEGRAHRRIGKFSHHLRLIAFFFPRQVGLADSTLFSSLLPRLQASGTSCTPVRCCSVRCSCSTNPTPAPITGSDASCTAPGGCCHHGLPLFRRVRDRRLLCTAGSQQRVRAH